MKMQWIYGILVMTAAYAATAPAAPAPDSRLNNSPHSSCLCHMDFTPVCGSDGITYGNLCALRCASARDSSLSKSHAGPCKRLVASHSCVCPEIYSPVCGSDGKMYDNECVVNCAATMISGLTVSKTGSCLDVNVRENANCYCPMNYSPVCGSDGKDYGNECELECAARHNVGLSVAHHGRCATRLRRNAQSPEKSFSFTPGSGVTVTGVSVKWDTPVVEKSVLECRSHCGGERDLVCGADDVSYLNPCFMACSGQQKKSDGSCDIKFSYTITRGPTTTSVSNA